MKALILSLGFLVAIVLGFLPPIAKARPLWWRIIAIALMSATVFLALYPPTSGTARDVIIAWQADSSRTVPVLVSSIQAGPQGSGIYTGVDSRGTAITIHTSGSVVPPTDGTPTILHLRGLGLSPVARLEAIGASAPTLTLPFIMGLEERARILYFHVPFSWIAVLAYLLALGYAVRYLRSGKIEFDDHVAAAAALGTVYTILATVTGAIWAKFNWGSFWNWDPRQTSIFVLLLIYAAYFALRASIEDPHRRARLSGVYAIVAFVTVPFLIYVLPRMFEGLHPGAQGDVNAGPVLSSDPDALNPLKQIILSTAFASFSLLFFWLMGLQVRLRSVERSVFSALRTGAAS